MKKFIFFFFLIVFSSFVFSYSTTYNKLGGDDDSFRGETGIFNSQLNTSGINLNTRPISNPRYSPYVFDLDNTGEKEIIVQAGTEILLFSDEDLDIIDGIDLLSNGIYSPLIIQDFDSDGFSEIMVVYENTSQTQRIAIAFINYSDGSFVVEKTFGLVTKFIDDIDVGCREDNTCMVIVSSLDSALPTSIGKVDRYGFNYSDVSGRNEQSLGAGTRFCPPNIKNVVTADYDNDGTEEFIFSSIRFEVGAAQESLQVAFYDLNASLFPVQEIFFLNTEPENVINANTDCKGADAGRFISAPITFDFDGLASNGLETIVAIADTFDEFQMISIKASGDKLDDYPEIFLADGIILSNPMIMNVFPDTGVVDVCVLGFNSDCTDSGLSDNCLNLLCASEQTGDIPETNEFLIDITTNITIGTNFSNNIVHAVQMSTLTTAGVNLHEIVTAFGVYELITEENPDRVIFCDTIGSCRLREIWGNIRPDSATLPIDYSENGLADIIALTSTNIWYIDDGFRNSDCSDQNCITSYTINPCLDAVWKQNTTVEVQLTLEDVDSDLLQGRVILYLNDDNEQDSGWSINVSSGTTISFGNFIVNTTSNIETLRLMARERFTPSINETIDLTFSVASTGVEFGDCITEVSLDIVDVEIDPTATDPVNNSVINTIDTLSESTGLGRTAWWFFAMIVVGVMMIVSNKPAKSGDYMMLIGITVLVEFFMLILGFLVGIISLSVLISVVVVAIVIIALFIVKAVFPTNAGG